MTAKKDPSIKQGHAHGPIIKAPAKAPTAWSGCPKVPDSITDADRWDRIWNFGGPGGAYDTTGDLEIVTRYCQLLERREQLLEILTAEGYLSEGSKGQEVQHPAVRILDGIEGRLGPIEDRLGLNPSSRLSLIITSSDVKSKLDSFMAEDTANET